MGQNFSTDLTPEHMIDLAKSMLQSDNRTIYSHTLKGDGHRKETHGAWYYFADEEDLAAYAAIDKAWLDPAKTKAELPLPVEYQVKVKKPVKSLSAIPEAAGSK